MRQYSVDALHQSKTKIRYCYCYSKSRAEDAAFFTDKFKTSIMPFIIKFGCNAHCHWLKERAL